MQAAISKAILLAGSLAISAGFLCRVANAGLSVAQIKAIGKELGIGDIEPAMDNTEATGYIPEGGEREGGLALRLTDPWLEGPSKGTFFRDPYKKRDASPKYNKGKEYRRYTVRQLKPPSK